MSHLQQQPADVTVQTPFAAAAVGKRRRVREKPAPPFSLRLNADERARLEREAAGLPLATYVKARLFDGDPARLRRRVRPAVKDQAALSQMLGMLGAMRLANNLNQLAKAANIGTLPLTPEVEKELTKACAAVLAMKAVLMRALGYPSDGES